MLPLQMGRIDKAKVGRKEGSEEERENCSSLRESVERENSSQFRRPTDVSAPTLTALVLQTVRSFVSCPHPFCSGHAFKSQTATAAAVSKRTRPASGKEEHPNRVFSLHCCRDFSIRKSARLHVCLSERAKQKPLIPMEGGREGSQQSKTNQAKGER